MLANSGLFRIQGFLSMAALFWHTFVLWQHPLYEYLVHATDHAYNLNNLDTVKGIGESGENQASSESPGFYIGSSNYVPYLPFITVAIVNKSNLTLSKTKESQQFH